MQLVEIEAQRAMALHAQGLTQHLGRDKGIPVAVATDPASDPQERRQLTVIPSRVDRAELVLQRCVKTRQLPKERVIVIGKAVGDLVDDGKPSSAQNVRLP